MARPHALFVAPAAPERTGNGLAMRLGLFLEALTRVADTELMVLPVAGSGESALAADLGIPTKTVPVADRLDTNYRLLQMIGDPAERLTAFRRYGRGSRHAALSLPILSEVRHHARNGHFDLVHTARLYLAEAGVSIPATLHTIDLDEDDAFAWRLRAQLDRKAGQHSRAEWAEAEAEAEERLLARVGQSFNATFIAGPTDGDRIAAQQGFPVPEVVPNGVAFPDHVDHRDDGSTLLFVGSLGYAPNVEGLLWFANDVLPRILAHGSVRLQIVGRGPYAGVEQLRGHPQIDLIGAVDRMSTAYERATIAIAPLLSGAGTRIKLIEAAAFEVAVVTTSIGVQGLDFGRNAYWEANGAEAFAQAVLEALASKPERLLRAQRARNSARLTHDRDQIVGSLARRFETMLASGSALQ